MRRGRCNDLCSKRILGRGEVVLFLKQKKIEGKGVRAAIDAQAGVIAKVDDATRALDAARQVRWLVFEKNIGRGCDAKGCCEEGDGRRAIDAQAGVIAKVDDATRALDAAWQVWGAPPNKERGGGRGVGLCGGGAAGGGAGE
jgi:hypothetical protein